MIKLKDLLLEVHLEDLYHATYHSRLIKILKDDAIKLAFTGGTEADAWINKGYHFFLSTMRAKYGNFVRSSDSSNSKQIREDTVIHLDGRALTAAGYKVFHVDYWGMGRPASEQEERIASNKNEIKPLSKFVKDIHVFVKIPEQSPSNLQDKFTLKRYHELDELAQKSSVPIYFYINGQESLFQLQRNERAYKSIKQFLPSLNWSDDDLESIKYYAKYDSPEYLQKQQTVLRAFLNIYNQVNLDDDYTKHILDLIHRYPHDVYPKISSEIHNLKKSHPSIFVELVNVMKKEKLKTIKDLVNFVIDRENKKNRY